MRLKTDQYKGEVRKEALLEHLDEIPFPLGVNGDMITTADLTDFSKTFREPKMLMVGRALMADPALFRKYKGGPAASLEEIKNFTDRSFRCLYGSLPEPSKCHDAHERVLVFPS